ncbi:hypothetical protein BDN71DRAFT_400619 [Pleurotus eryngii]|uniref:Uncharacterized protein n=1 Tax=Pleurotus eryngii TaxID=5323 RepID=A0A9P6DAQ1_PLEER|nr:hypothetical protein BDN71DRAFT_400619 [Pleurotus eryngii]
MQRLPRRPYVSQLRCIGNPMPMEIMKRRTFVSAPGYLGLRCSQKCIAALQIEPLRNAHSQGNAEVKWWNEFGDSSRFSNFSLFLHHPSISSDFTILSDQDASDSAINVTLPLVLAQDGYTLRATEVSNTTHDLAVSLPFPIGTAEVDSPPTASGPTTGSLSGTGSSTAAPGGPTSSNAGERVGIRGSEWAMVAAVMGAVCVLGR